MPIAVPAAILYTRNQYAFLSSLVSKFGHESSKSLGNELPQEVKEELLMWKQLRSDLLNGSRWYGVQRGWLRMDKILSHTDASSRRWAGVYSSPDFILRISEDFSQDEVQRHINEKEAMALYKFLWNLLQKDPLLFEGKTIHIQVDNEVLNRIYNRGGSSRQLFITNICKKLFWLQVQYKCQLEVSGVATISNQVDAMTREDMYI